MRGLVTVESPAKTKNWKKYTGMNCMATNGHFKGLPKKEMAIDLKTYAYKFIIDNPNIVKRLKELAKGVDVYIAADGDREGEAIGYMTYEVVKNIAKNVYRVKSGEITQTGIENAMNNKVLYEDYTEGFYQYKAFLGRRLSDRMSGYILSPIANKMLNKDVGKDNKTTFSVGRVQSCGTMLIYDREMEIRKFKPEPFYSLSAFIKVDEENDNVELLYEDTKMKDLPTVEQLVQELKGHKAIVSDIQTKRGTSQPVAPYSTSTFQQDCSSKLGISPKEAMAIAQKLYEGKVKGYEGEGLITYMRTDMTSCSDEFNQKMRDFIAETMGADKLPASAIKHKSKASQAEAHEGIRITKLGFDSSVLSGNEKAVYDLIASRTIASQMKPVVFYSTTILFDIGSKNFTIKAQQIEDKGYLEVYKRATSKEVTLPKVNVGDEFQVNDFNINNHKTKPPKRYTEASLTKKLEAEGIGRPSTYVTITETIKARGYAELRGNKKEKVFHLLPKGEKFIVWAKEQEETKWLLDYGYTRSLENELDLVENGKKDYIEILKDVHSKMGFYIPKDKKKVFIENIPCPVCNKRLADEEKVIVCESYKYDKDKGISTDCPFILFKNPIGITKDNLSEILDGEIQTIERTYEKDGEKETKNVEFVINEKLIQSVKKGIKVKKGETFLTKKLNGTGITCPKCGGEIVDSGKQFHCENDNNIFDKGKWKNIGSCTFRLLKENTYLGYTLTIDLLRDLINGEIIKLDNGKEIVFDINHEYLIKDKNKKEMALTGLLCPYCKSDIVQNDFVFSCSTKKKKSCKFKAFKENKFKNFFIDLKRLERLLDGDEVDLGDGRSLTFEKENEFFFTLHE